jgi:hypothetical protein
MFTIERTGTGAAGDCKASGAVHGQGGGNVAGERESPRN